MPTSPETGAMRALVAALRSDPDAKGAMLTAAPAAGLRSSQRQRGRQEGDLYERPYALRHDPSKRQSQSTSGLRGSGMTAAEGEGLSVAERESGHGRRGGLHARYSPRNVSGLTGPGLVAESPPPRAPPIKRQAAASQLSFNPQGHVLGGTLHLDPAAEALLQKHIATDTRLRRREHSAPCRRDYGRQSEGGPVRGVLSEAQYGYDGVRGGGSCLTWGRLGRRRLAPPTRQPPPRPRSVTSSPRRPFPTCYPHPRMPTTDGFGCIPVDDPEPPKLVGHIARSPSRNATGGSAAWDPPPRRPRRGRRVLTPCSDREREGGIRVMPQRDCIDWFHRTPASGPGAPHLRSGSADCARLSPHLCPARRAVPSRAAGQSTGPPPLPTDDAAAGGAPGRRESLGRRHITASPDVQPRETREWRPSGGVRRSFTPQPRGYDILAVPPAERPATHVSVNSRGNLNRQGHFASPANMAHGTWAPLGRADTNAPPVGSVQRGRDKVAWSTMRIWHEAAASPRKGGRAAGHENPQGSAASHNVISWAV